ncbi:thymic stromal lymphopoietin [Camelus ferus]|uniref:Thymic stromal lymphopoietin n=1 Tax=Camelus ferus TaxID=419612 RepID=A0A8B8S2G6_CAMFR|nr:thymic stromal lymphopoietin [Camelus ferus]
MRGEGRRISLPKDAATTSNPRLEGFQKSPSFKSAVNQRLSDTPLGNSSLLLSLKRVSVLRPQVREAVEATRRGAKAKRRHAGRTNRARLRASRALDSTLPGAFRCARIPPRSRSLAFSLLNAGLKNRAVKSVFFRKIFILQLVGLALTYNFTDCDFEKIKETYQNVIYEVLKEYIKGTKSIRFNRFVYCEDRVSKWLMLLSFSREMQGIPRRGYPGVCNSRRLGSQNPSGIPGEAPPPTPSRGKANPAVGPGDNVRGTLPGCEPPRSAPPLGPRDVGGASGASGARVFPPKSPSAILTAPLLPSPSSGSFPSAHPIPLSSYSNRLYCDTRSSPTAPVAPFTHVLSALFFFLLDLPPLAFSSFLVRFAACEQPDCLTKIERFTFERNHGCTSLASEIFAEQTNATFALHCTGYPGIEISITQAMKTRREREVKTNKCLEQVSKLIELWRRFCRIKQSKTSLKSHFTATE